MSKPQKILTTILWGLTVLAMFLFLALSNAKKRLDSTLAVTPAETDLPVLFDLPEFSLLDQDGKEFTDAQLRGRPFVACFVFTRCAGPCPMMFLKMSAMQQAVPNDNVKLVTFTVDPTRDTPEVLKAKATELGAEPNRWFFLTGTKDSIHQLLRGMLMPTPTPDDDPLMHTEQFYLFDADGKCRGRYASSRDEEMAALAKDAQMLAERAAEKKS